MDLFQHMRRIHRIVRPTDPPHRMELPLPHMKALLMELVHRMHPDQPQPLTEPALMEPLRPRKLALTGPLHLMEPLLLTESPPPMKPPPPMELHRIALPHHTHHLRGQLAPMKPLQRTQPLCPIQQLALTVQLHPMEQRPTRLPHLIPLVHHI